MSGGFPESPHIPGVHAKTNYNGFGKPVVPDPSSPNSVGGDARPDFQDQINALQTAIYSVQYDIGQLQGLLSALQNLSGDVADVKGRVADNIAAITTLDATDESSTQALANELKSVVNLILTKLKLADLMEDDE